MNYHIARDGQQIGVFPKEDVLAKIQQGTIKATDLAWAEGMPDWKLVSEVFADAFPQKAPEAAVAHTPVPSQAQPASAQPQAAYSSGPGTGMGAATNLPPKPENYLVWAILATVLCCLPLGIVSIIFAAQVDSKYRAGDYHGALESSRKAKSFAWWSFGVGLTVTVIVVAIQVVAAITAASGGY